MNIEDKKVAFTLAEVLITLGIIGIVAAMTLPALITKYQKQVTVNRLKHAYSVLSQAVKLSEVYNGPIDNWDFPEERNTDAAEVWLKKNICPYMKYSDIINPSTLVANNQSVDIKLTNGTVLSFWFNTAERFHVFIFLNPNKPTQSGKNYFAFYAGKSQGYGPNNVLGSNMIVRPYDFSNDAGVDNTRAFWKDDVNRGCNRNNDNKGLCAGLIMYDGWEIKDDYPW
ncbi:type II secretion system protein [bacterium]|nr:type II secretion system protein [bacterium]